MTDSRVRRYALLGLLLVLSGLTGIVWAPAPAAAVDLSDTVPFHYNFDAGIGIGVSLADGWQLQLDRTDTAPNYYALWDSFTNVPTQPMTNTDAAGTYNFWDGADANATDRCAGWLGSGSTRSGGLYFVANNDSSDTFYSFTISYGIEKYREGLLAEGFTIRLYYSLTGDTSSWTLAGNNFKTDFPGPDGSNDGYADHPGSTTRVDSQTLTVTVGPGQQLYLCWNYAPTSGSTFSSAQALGIDDFAILPAGTPPQAQIIFNEFLPYGTPDWIEFYVVQGGVLEDTIVKSDGSQITLDTDPVKPTVAAGDYIVLWFTTGDGDAAINDNNAGYWDFYWNGAGGMTGTDDSYRLYMSGSAAIQDFIGWANQDVTLNADDQDALRAAFETGQWDTTAITTDQMDFIRSNGASGGAGHDPNNTDTNSRYGWEWFTSGLTAGSANQAFANYQGQGCWSVSPAGGVTAGSSGTWEFTYTPGAQAFSDGYLTLTVPSGWTTPQVGDSAAAGYVWVTGNLNDINSQVLVDAKAIIDDTVIIVPVNLTTDSIIIVYGYGGGAAAAVAPGAPGSYTFLMASDPKGSNVSYLDTSPSLTVVSGTPLAVYLNDLAADTIGPDSTSVTILAGRVVGNAAGDSLTNFQIVNNGTGDNGDTKYVGAQGGITLWADVNGDSAWDAGDSLVGTLNWTGTAWGMSSSTIAMNGGVFNFVVTVNVGSSPANLHTFRMGIDVSTLTSSASADGPTSDTDNSFSKTIWIPPANPGDLIFTEISWAGTGGGAGTEWFELYNTTTGTLNLNGYLVGDGEDTHTFGALSIPANGYFLCEASEGATSVTANDIYGDDAGSLTMADGGDGLLLIDAVNTVIDQATFAAVWPAGATTGGLGAGYVSMERRDLAAAIAGDTGPNWLDGPFTVGCGAVGGVSGTPGAENSMASWRYLKVNEVCFDDVNSPDQNDWIEIYNASDTPVNVYLWEVTDFDASGDFTLPQVAIPGKGFIVCHYGTGTDETAFGSPISVLNVFNGNGNALAASADQAAIFTDAAHDTYAIIDFVAWAQTPGTDEVDAWLAAQTGQWPATTVQIDVVNSNNVGRAICRVTDGGDTNTSDTGDWRELANTEINFFSEGGTNKSNSAGTLTGVSALTVLATNTDLAAGYNGASGDSAWIRLTGTDNDAADTNTTTCTVVASLSDAVGIVLTLRETGLATGIFEGYLYLRGNTNDAIEWITVTTGDVVTITSVDGIAFFDTIVIGQASGIGGIVINEFLADVGATSETEFIELYNTTGNDLYIAGCYLDDISGGGSAPYQIPTTGTSADTIPAYGFRTFWGLVTGISLGNSGDDVRFLDTDNNTIISSRTYASATNNVSEGREYDGGSNWVYFDGVNDPDVTPDSTNNPGPYISTVALTSDIPDSFYFDGVVDTSIIGGSTAASCTAWFSNAGAQNVTITVYGLYTYNNSVCTGSAAFGDAIQTAGQASSPYSVTYSVEAGLGSQDVTIFLRDNVYANDSLTIHFEEDHTPPQVDFIGNSNLTTVFAGNFYDTIAVTDTGVGYNLNRADTPQQRWRWATFNTTWSETDACDSGSDFGLTSLQYFDDTINAWAALGGDTLYWEVRVKDAVGNWTVAGGTGEFASQELVEAGNNPPTVVIGVPADGDTYSNDVSCSFVISDNENDSCWLSLEASFDSGVTWFSPTIVGSLGPLNSSGAGTATIVIWQTATDYGGMSCTFVMRASVRDGTDTGTGDTTYHFGIDNLAPAAPTGLWAVGDTETPDTGVYLTWNHVVSTDTAGYYVYGDTDADGNWQRVSPLLTDTNAAWWSILNPGDTWVFAVRCADAAGNESGHSDTATAPFFVFDKYAASCLLGGAAALPVPGATLEWRLRVLDAGFGPGDSVTIEDTVYVGTVYKAGSAAVVAGSGYTAIITYSHDSGATWDDQETLPVTNIRWSIIEWMATNSILEVKYEAYIP